MAPTCALDRVRADVVAKVKAPTGTDGIDGARARGGDEFSVDDPSATLSDLEARLVAHRAAWRVVGDADLRLRI